MDIQLLCFSFNSFDLLISCFSQDNWYSNEIVYTNYPLAWKNPTDKQIKSLLKKKHKKFWMSGYCFRTVHQQIEYDPLTMPPALVKAHNELDRAVDLAYRPQPFISEANRMVYLFELYEKYTADLFTKGKTKIIKMKRQDEER